MRLRRRILSGIPLVVGALLLAGTLGQATGKNDGSSEGAPTGRLLHTGKIPVLVLEGSFLEMGRQYGRLHGETLRRLYRVAILEHFVGRRGLAPEALLELGRRFLALYPERLRAFLVGMSETAGLSLDAHVILNALELFGGQSGCSAIAAWGDFSGGSPLVFGRNYDWFEAYARFARTLTVTVLRPDSGVPTAFVTFAGVIYATTGMNTAGLFVELNNGQPSGGDLTFSDRVPTEVLLLSFLLDASNEKQLHALFQTSRAHFSFIINVASPQAAWSYEWPPFGIRRRAGQAGGLLVSTNHFVDPGWGILVQDTKHMRSEVRRRNLLALAERFRGGIDAAKMREILDTPLDRGGATWPDRGPYRTVYQVIAVPGELAWWLKVPGYQDWIPLSLEPLLRAEHP